jgi:hypothetical protein
MALQSSGPISFSNIKTELSNSSNSLRTLSAAAGFSIPDAVSEFYGYSSVSTATVTTNSITGVQETYMTLNGNVSSNGGASLTERGFYFGTNSTSPTASGNFKVNLGGQTGNFSTTRYSLSAGTTYYAWAYAINAGGTAFGNRVQATTIAAYAPTWYNTYSGDNLPSSSNNFNRCDYDCGAPNVGHRRRGYLYYLNPNTSSWVNYATMTQGAECSYIPGQFNFHNAMSNSGGRGNGQFALGVRNMAQSIIDVDATGINQGGYHRVTIQQSPKNNVTYSNTNSTLYTYNSISYRIQCLAEIGAGCPSNSELRAEWDGV